MRNAGNPARARAVPAGKLRALRGEPAAEGVELFGQLAGHAAGVELDRAAAGQRVDALTDAQQTARRAKAEQQAGGEDQRAVQNQQGQAELKQRAQQRAVQIEVKARDAALGHAGHQQAEVVAVDEDGVIVQVPARERGDLSARVAVVEVERQIALPEDLAVVAKEHGEGIARHPVVCLRLVRRNPAVCVLRKRRGKAAELKRSGVLPAAVIHDHAQQNRRVDGEDQQDDHERGGDMPPDEEGKGLHGCSSMASL